MAAIQSLPPCFSSFPPFSYFIFFPQFLLLILSPSFLIHSFLTLSCFSLPLVFSLLTSPLFPPLSPPLNRLSSPYLPILHSASHTWFSLQENAELSHCVVESVESLVEPDHPRGVQVHDRVSSLG